VIEDFMQNKAPCLKSQPIADAAKTISDSLQHEPPDLILSHIFNMSLPFLAVEKYNIPTFWTEFCVEDHNEGFFQLMFKTWKSWHAPIIRRATGQPFLKSFSFEDFMGLRSASNWLYLCSPTVADMHQQKHTESWVKQQRDLCKGFLVMDESLQTTNHLDSFGGSESFHKLEAYLESGPKPVYIGWGSMPVPTEYLLKLIVALKQHSLRAVVCTGWGGHTLEAVSAYIKLAMPDDALGLASYAEQTLLFIESAPHEWLFPRCACTIHHGGAGTTCTAARAGVPTIITPLMVDQYAWADWVCHLGVGLKLSLTENQDVLTDPDWINGVHRGATDPQLAEAAHKFSIKLKSEDGVNNMVEFVKSAVEQRRMS